MKKVLLIALLALGACTKFPAQKAPWPVGYSPLYTHNITLDYAPPLTVDSAYLDTYDIYDGANHYFYSVHDANGKPFTHVIDYQLSTKK